MPNTGNGVEIKLGSQRNRIGTNGDGQRRCRPRVISGTASKRSSSGARDTLNVVAGNYGTDKTGTARGNASNGRKSTGAINIIGTDGSNDAFSVDERNVIAGNLGVGLIIHDIGTQNNVVAGSISERMRREAPLANLTESTSSEAATTGSGSTRERARDHRPARPHLRQQHRRRDFRVRHKRKRGRGNSIGTNAAGSAVSGNFIGVGIDSSASSNTIGGTATSTSI